MPPPPPRLVAQSLSVDTSTPMATPKQYRQRMAEMAAMSAQEREAAEKEYQAKLAAMTAQEQADYQKRLSAIMEQERARHAMELETSMTKAASEHAQRLHRERLELQSKASAEQAAMAQQAFQHQIEQEEKHRQSVQELHRTTRALQAQAATGPWEVFFFV